MSIQNELLKFAARRPQWQRDLMRRICIQPDISEEDLANALINLKASEAMNRESGLICLTAAHLSQRSTTPHPKTTLLAISEVENTNRLAGNQHLPFAVKGITLIYGDNGSGKTGYVRIVKQVCRARRDKPEPLLGDVYRGNSGAATAKITFRVGEQQREIRWEDGKPVPSELSRISVFDASTAPLYADQENKIEFLPLGLDVLPRLGKACERLAQQLQVEIETLRASISVPLPPHGSGTTADRLTRLLVPETPVKNLPSDEELRVAAVWSKEHEERLRKIEQALKKLSEPAAAAAQCRRFRTSIEGFCQRLHGFDQLLSQKAVTGYREQLARAQSTREVALTAAQGRFDQEPLGKAVGSAAWQLLYQYAQRFNAEVYPGEAFPATGKDRVCLLCQQPLSELAADRLRRFKAFMEDTSQREAEKEESQLNQMRQVVSGISAPDAQELELYFAELSAADPTFDTVKTKLASFLTEVTQHKTSLIAALNGQLSFASIGVLDNSALRAASDFGSALEDKAKEFDKADVNTEATSQLNAEHGELLGRQQLKGSLESALLRRTQLVTYDKLRLCKEKCDTTQISRKNSDLREKYLTADFATEIDREITFLGLEYLPFRVQGHTEKGTGYIGVGLHKVLNARNSNILSEGEFRALALACFFAEIASIPNHDGIVIDDPVSSLDHRHMRRVAKRLVAEATKRSQVIVFTHDLSFYYELVEAAAEAGISVHRNWVQHRLSQGFGVVVSDDGPWQVKKTHERISILEQLLNGMPSDCSVSKKDYEKHVGQFYGTLRQTWERLVEELLLNNVVGRFQTEVKTQSLKSVTVTDEDYRKVFFAMKKASEYSGHDWATARECVLPTKTSMLEDLMSLQDYQKELRKRKGELEKKRRELEGPSKAEIVSQASK